MSTASWLRELGAIRPMASAGDEVLVLGQWHDGLYPIEWRRFRDTITRDASGNLVNREPIEQWRIFGFLTHDTVTQADCERILRAIEQRTSQP